MRLLLVQLFGGLLTLIEKKRKITLGPYKLVGCHQPVRYNITDDALIRNVHNRQQYVSIASVNVLFSSRYSLINAKEKQNKCS